MPTKNLPAQKKKTTNKRCPPTRCRPKHTKKRQLQTKRKTPGGGGGGGGANPASSVNLPRRQLEDLRLGDDARKVRLLSHLGLLEFVGRSGGTQPIGFPCGLPSINWTHPTNCLFSFWSSSGKPTYGSSFCFGGSRCTDQPNRSHGKAPVGALATWGECLATKNPTNQYPEKPGCKKSAPSVHTVWWARAPKEGNSTHDVLRVPRKRRRVSFILWSLKWQPKKRSKLPRGGGRG